MADTRIDDTQASNWAQEETLRRLLKEASVTSRILEDYVRAKLSKDEFEAIKDNVEATKRNTTVTSGALQMLGNRTDRTLQSAYRDLDRSLSGQFKDLTRSMNNIDGDSLVGGLRSAGEKAGKGLMGLSKDMVGLSSRLTFAAGGLLTFGAVILEGWKLVSNLNDNYLRLYESGINFTQGLRGMTQASGDLGLSTQELVAAFGQYSTTVAVLGTDRTVKLGKEFTKLNRNMGELGMTNVQATETMLEYASLMKNTGQLGRMTNKQLVEGTTEYAKELNQITAITGQNRKEIQKSIEARAKETGYQALLRSLPKEVQENITKSMMALEKLGPAGAQAAQKTVVAMLARGGLSGLDPALRQVINQTGLFDTFDSLSKKAAQGEDITDEMGVIAQKLGDPAVFQSFQQFADMPGPVGDMIRNMSELAMSTEGMRKQEEELKAAAKEKYDSLTADEKKLTSEEKILADLRKKAAADANARNKLETEAQQTLNAASEALTSIFNTLVVDVMKPLLPALKFFADVIIKITELFKGLQEGLGGILRYFGLGSGKAAEKDAEGNETKPRETDWTDTAGSLAATGMVGASMWGLKRGVSRLRGRGGGGAGGGGMLSRLTGGGGGVGGAAGGGDGGPIGKAMDMVNGGGGSKVTEAMNKMGGVSGGAVKGFQATMEGLAGGLKAFKNPALIMYAGIFSAALALVITGVGAGLAAATWLMGAALPKFAEGMRSFTDLDGKKLSEVGSGMVSLGAGMAAMGAGEVVGAFGSLAGAISKLWGNDPIAKLKAFAEIGEPLQVAADGIQRFTSVYPQAISQLNNATLGNNASVVLGQIQELFGADGSGWFGTEPAIIGQINALASSISALATSANGLNSANQAQSQPQTDALSKRTLEFYDDAKNSYNSMVTLLQSMDGKLDLLDRSTRDGTSEITRAIGKAGNVF